MIFGLTDTGFVIKTFDNILLDIEAYQKTNISNGLSPNRSNTRGQINTSVAQEIAELWEVAQETFAAQYKDTASGIYLDYVCALTGTYRIDPTKTRVYCTIEMNPNKALPIGSVAHLEGQPEVRFFSMTEVPADPIGGETDLWFEAENAGAIAVAANQLNSIAEPVVGWTSITNGDAGITGLDSETDPELRLKQENSLGQCGSTTVDAIRARLIALDSVNDATVLENVSDVTDSYLTAPHTIWCIIKTTAPPLTEVYEAIFLVKAGGIDTRGAYSDNVTDEQGREHLIRVDVGEEVEVDVVCNFTLESGADELTTEAAVEAAITAYIGNLQLGETLFYNNLFCLIDNVDGVDTITSLTLNGGTSNITCTFQQFIVLDDLTVDGS